MAVNPAVNDVPARDDYQATIEDDVGTHLAGVDVRETDDHREYLGTLAAKRATEAADQARETYWTVDELKRYGRLAGVFSLAILASHRISEASDRA